MRHDGPAQLLADTGIPSFGFEASVWEAEPNGRETAAAVLRAVAVMASASNRQQAELAAALHRAGLTLDSSRQQAALRYLCDIAAVEDVIPLADGGILLSVTAAGMERGLR